MDSIDFRTAIADGIREELRAYPVDVIRPVCDYLLEIRRFGDGRVVKLTSYDPDGLGNYHAIVQAWDGSRLFTGIEDPEFFVRVAAEIASLLNVCRRNTAGDEEAQPPHAQD